MEHQLITTKLRRINMVANINTTLDWDLGEALNHCSQNFSGQLHIRSDHGYEWCFHFFMGRIVGESEGVHAARRWQRLFSQNSQIANKIRDNKLELAEFVQGTSVVLEKMVKKGQITREQALQWSRTSILESMFDILHLQWLCTQSGSYRLSFSLVPSSQQKGGVLPWIFFRTPELYQEALNQFFTWRQNSLGRYSPNLAPVLKGLVPVNASAFERNLLALLDGERTVRDLSLKLDRDPLEIMQTLLPFIDRGLVSLKAIPDLIPHKTHQPVATPPVELPPKPVVAYVDDNPMESKLMGSILTEMGCEYVPITDPIKALPELLKRKPDLIFLDLVMPIVNGYEVCAQIRRVPSFAETPVVILTANDGIVDRVRAKVVGSTEFLSKPIDRVKVSETLLKYNVIKAPTTQALHQFQVQGSF
jgi:chemotaxis family two-component system response regulator PixG